MFIRAADHFCPNRRSSARIEERVVRDELSKVRCAASWISSRAGTSKQIKFIVEKDGGTSMKEDARNIWWMLTTCITDATPIQKVTWRYWLIRFYLNLRLLGTSPADALEEIEGRIKQATTAFRWEQSHANVG